MSIKQIIVVLLMLLGTSGLSQPFDDDDLADKNNGFSTPARRIKPGREGEDAPRKKRVRGDVEGPDFGERLFQLPPGVDEAQWLAEVAAEHEELKRQRAEEGDENGPSALQAQYDGRIAAENPLRDALRALALRAVAQNPCGIEVGELGFRMF